MKTKSFLYLGAILLLASGIFTGCKKTPPLIQEETKNPVAYYTKKFMRDTAFVDLFEAVVGNSVKLTPLSVFDKHKSFAQAREVTIDSNAAYNYVAEIVTAEVMLKSTSPGFFELPLEEQKAVMNNVVTNLATDSYQQANATTPLVVFADATLDELNNYQPVDISSQIDISWGEFAACAAASLFGALGDYGGIVGQVWRLFTQGGQYLTTAAIFQIAGRVVRNAVPWYKVVGITYSFGSCLWAAA